MLYKPIKRLIDLIVASIALLLLAPLLSIVAVLVRAILGSPVLFRQTRPGRHARAFQIYKFRSMHEAFDAAGRPLPDHERIGRLGRLLRRTSVDELPQLWNVLRGDMSLVGPRPLFSHYLPWYSAREQRRHEVRPGMTGLAQVSGRTRLGWDEKLELDVKYVEQMSFLLDLRIIGLTIRRVLRSSDILDAAPQGPLHAYRSQGRQSASAETDVSHA